MSLAIGAGSNLTSIYQEVLNMKQLITGTTHNNVWRSNLKITWFAISSIALISLAEWTQHLAFLLVGKASVGSSLIASNLVGGVTEIISISSASLSLLQKHMNAKVKQ